MVHALASRRGLVRGVRGHVVRVGRNCRGCGVRVTAPVGLETRALKEALSDGLAAQAVHAEEIVERIVQDLLGTAWRRVGVQSGGCFEVAEDLGGGRAGEQTDGDGNISKNKANHTTSEVRDVGVICDVTENKRRQEEKLHAPVSASRIAD